MFMTNLFAICVCRIQMLFLPYIVRVGFYLLLVLYSPCPKRYLLTLAIFHHGIYQIIDSSRFISSQYYFSLSHQLFDILDHWN